MISYIDKLPGKRKYYLGQAVCVFYDKAPPTTNVHTVEVQYGSWRRRRYLEGSADQTSLRGSITRRRLSFVYHVTVYATPMHV